jgi:hypothetical protein
LLLALAADVAHADRREASLHAHLVGGAATTRYVADFDTASAESATAPMGGLAIRASYATHDSFQYDLAVAFLATGASTFGEATFHPTNGSDDLRGPFKMTSQVARLDGGVTLRLGVRFIPTLRLAGGVQARRTSAPTVTMNGVEYSGEGETGRGSVLGVDLVGSATVGLDYRVNKRVIVGAAGGASYAVPLGGAAFRTVELTFHAAAYWYPRW